MKNFKFLFGLAAVLLLVGSGCGDYEDRDDAEETNVVVEEKEPIKIGWMGPLSGDAVVYGDPIKNTLELAVEEINEAGGIDGALLEVVYEDDKCNGKDGVAAIQKLINVDKVQLVFGGVCSGATLAAAPVANQNKVLLFSSAATSPELTTKGGKYFFRDYPSDATQGQVLADVAFNKKNWKKVAVIQEQTDYAQGFYEAFTKRFKELGGEVVGYEAFASDATDFRTALTKLKDAEPDALLVSTQAPAATELVLKQMKEMDWNPGRIAIDAVVTSDFPEKAPELYEGILGAQFDPNLANEDLQKYVENYKIKFGNEPEFLAYTQAAYDAAYIVKDALEAVGNDGESLQEWFDDLEGWQGVSGEISFDENGDRATGVHAPVVIKDGATVPFVE